MILRLFFIIFSAALFAREVPNLSGPVVDEANLLSNAAKNSLESYLYRYKSDTGNQVQVLIIDSLEGDALENFSIKVTDKWKLGEEKKDNGLLFLVSLKDRKIRIEVGQGLEGDLPDVLAGRIIEGVKPYFKRGQFEEGIFFGVELITKALKGDTREIPKKRTMSLIHIFIIIIFLVWVFLNKFFWFLPIMGGHRSRGGFSTRGGGFGGGFGGGGWSGGGGGFSGGGASGRW